MIYTNTKQALQMLCELTPSTTWQHFSFLSLDIRGKNPKWFLALEVLVIILVMNAHFSIYDNNYDNIF